MSYIMYNVYMQYICMQNYFKTPAFIIIKYNFLKFTLFVIICLCLPRVEQNNSILVPILYIMSIKYVFPLAEM